ncbi:hypothetical protein, variant [Exophiala sideris]|uniref:Uncharacterized protein n=1 Tax=Exophiala sideris TaxID=1016849 RepID=A0A0D1YXC1_9EURO|nr:hypothetical protein, variant [Exophiala sideris]
MLLHRRQPTPQGPQKPGTLILHAGGWPREARRARHVRRESEPSTRNSLEHTSGKRDQLRSYEAQKVVQWCTSHYVSGGVSPFNKTLSSTTDVHPVIQNATVLQKEEGGTSSKISAPCRSFTPTVPDRPEVPVVKISIKG